MDKEMHALAERWANLEDQRKQIGDDIKDLRAEAESRGYDKKLLARAVRIMRMEADKRAKELDQHQLFDFYLAGCGLIASTPVGRAVERAAKQTKPKAAEPAHDADGVIAEPDDVPHTLGTEEFDDLDPPASPGRISVSFRPEHAPALRAAAEKLRRGEVGDEHEQAAGAALAAAIDDGLDIPASLRRN